MKFIMMVFAIRFIAEVISNKRKKIKDNTRDDNNDIVFHPAEYGLR